MLFYLLQKQTILLSVKLLLLPFFPGLSPSPTKTIDFDFKLNLKLDNVDSCVFKIKRFSDSNLYQDISEILLHSNNPRNKIFYFFNSFNDTALTPDTFLLHDIHFFEICVINFIIKYDAEDGPRRIKFISSNRDSLRGMQFSVWIVITALSRQGFLNNCSHSFF